MHYAITNLGKLLVDDSCDNQYEFKNTDGHKFNNLIDHAQLTIDDLFAFITRAITTFEAYDISRIMQSKIDRYINSLYKYDHIWTHVFMRPDYNKVLFNHRMLPFEQVDSKEWKKANVDAINDYPHEITKDTDFVAEQNYSTKNNNFLSWDILPVENYPNIDKYIAQMIVLKKLKMYRQIVNMACRLMLSPCDCHIAMNGDFWSILSDINNTIINDSPEINVRKSLDKLYEYCCNYSMYILRQEETIMFSQIKAKYRVLVDLEDASRLQTFGKHHLEQNPYIIQLTDTRILHTVPFHLTGERKLNDYETFNKRFDMATGGAFKGIDLSSIGGAVTGSILIPCVHTSPLETLFVDDELNRRRQNYALKHEFMIDTPKTKEDVAFMNYLEYYYPSYVSLTDDDFKNQVMKEGEMKVSTAVPIIIYGQETQNNVIMNHLERKQAKREAFNKYVEKKINDKSSIDSFIDDNIEEFNMPEGVNMSEDAEMPINKQNRQEHMVDKYSEAFLDQNEEVDVQHEVDAQHKDLDENLNEDLNDSTKNHNKKSRKQKKNKDKKDKKNKKNKNKIQDKKVDKKVDEKVDDNNDGNDSKYEDKTIAKIGYNQLADIDLSITTMDLDTFIQRVTWLYEKIKQNCQHRGNVYIKEVHTIASIKYTIYGPGLPRPIDVFRIPYDPAKMVKKFHVNAVKMYYNGRVTMFRACVSTLISGVGDTYKWFSCNKNPADVLLKYAQRGISIILNKKERDALSNYITSNPRWNRIIKNLQIKPTDIYRPVTYLHPFFRSGLYNAGIRLGLRNFNPDMPKNNNILCCVMPTCVTPYGELKARDINQWYIPNVNHINACLDYLEM